MPDQEVVSGLQRIFEEALGIPAPDPETDIIEAALLDSLALVTLLFEIEQRFAVQMPLDSLEIEDLRTVESIAGLVDRYREQRRSRRSKDGQ